MQQYLYVENFKCNFYLSDKFYDIETALRLCTNNVYKVSLLKFVTKMFQSIPL